MHGRRTSRIRPDDVDRLIAGDATGPEHRGLAALLASARSPASPHEMAGERAAIARFAATYRDGTPTHLPKARGPRPARAAIKVAASVAALAISSAAVAAETGYLPAAAQRQAHYLFAPLGVPEPAAPVETTRAMPARTRAPADPSTASPPPTRGAGAPAPGGVSAPGGARARGLCQAWEVQRRHGKPMPARPRQELAGLAGTAGIPDFCAGYLTGATDQPSAGTGNGNGQGSHVTKPRPTAGPRR